MKKEEKLKIAEILNRNLDNLHFTYRPLYAYSKDILIVICEREAGKTTENEIREIILPFLTSGYTSAYLVRHAIEITEDLITSIELRINNFIKDPLHYIHFKYSKKEFKDGIASIYIDDELVFKIIALGMPLQRLKKITILNLRRMIFDEYIVNTRLGEKFLKGEAFKIKELFTTLQRFEYKEKGLKLLISGNPYSKYTPLFMDLNINSNKLHSGALLIGANYVLQCYKISEKLKESILKKNPFYEFDDTYKKFAFDGEYTNDENIKIEKRPEDYSLKFVFRFENRYIGIFKNNYVKDKEDRYFVSFIDTFSAKRVAYCFSFDDLINGSLLVSSDEKMLFVRFRNAMRKNLIAYSNAECYYISREIYKNL